MGNNKQINQAASQKFLVLLEILINDTTIVLSKTINCFQICAELFLNNVYRPLMYR